jgi:hypothetical protein
VLACVCKGCNAHFGKSIDRTLSRDSFEAVARIHEGLKKPEEWKGEGTRSTLRFEYAPDGPFRGVPAHVVAAPKGGQTLGVTPAPRVGFARDGETPHWFALDQVPTKDDLIARGFPRDGGAVTVHIEGGLSLDVVRSTRTHRHPDRVGVVCHAAQQGRWARGRGNAAGGPAAHGCVRPPHRRREHRPDGEVVRGAPVTRPSLTTQYVYGP